MRFDFSVITPPDANPGVIMLGGVVVATLDSSGNVNSGGPATPSISLDDLARAAGLPMHVATPSIDIPPTSVIAVAINDATQTRNGNRYNGRTQQRISPLTPGVDLDYEYGAKSSIQASVAALHYNGTVRVVMPDMSIATVALNQAQPMPVDYFLYTDKGTFPRCDQYARVHEALRDLKPDDTGVISGGGSTSTGGSTNIPIGG